ncbi:hypothetical protein [Stutzerimonas urumqiensis]|uniref:hypothetical protein n=1 Tax=Stutzerimonas urumqiensis TaxID=638269 RepID=UPI000EB2D5E9|nr:hypothetical protein [Stutzerimonas urumqiensis]
MHGYLRLRLTFRPLKGAVPLCLAGLLAACAGNPYQNEPPRPVPPTPPKVEPARPVITPPRIQTPPAPSRPSVQRSHPRYAPPPHAQAHWDNRLGVYVVEGARGLYYRQRVYYRWDGQWLSASRPAGPWESIAPPSVPPGLRALH